MAVVTNVNVSVPRNSGRDILHIALIVLRQDYGGDSGPMGGQHFLLDPPTGRTLPRSVISPVMATSPRGPADGGQ